jgi:prepilin-type N-terminal cleavage/methylation domain-containing protein
MSMIKLVEKHQGLSMKRSAFTMLELVFVIVVIGILAALALPRINRDIRQEAADTILSNIRYTQHLALLDNKHKFDDAKWQQRYWKIMFGTCTGTDRFFMIGSDDNMDGGSSGDFNITEAAKDPTSGKPMFWSNGTACPDGSDGTVSPQIFITKKYGINSYSFSGGCSSSQYIGFDHLGRPHVGFATSNIPDQSSYMSSDCTITFNFIDGDISPLQIKINKETGYAYIVGQPDS